MEKIKSDEIGNYRGDFYIESCKNGKYYWCVEDEIYGDDKQEIPKRLYNEIKKFLKNGKN